MRESRDSVECNHYLLSGKCSLWREGYSDNPSACSIYGLCLEDDGNEVCSVLYNETFSIPYSLSSRSSSN